MTDFLTAQAAVTDLYERYTDAVFRKDVEAVGDCYTEDAEWRISGMLMQGRGAIVEQIKAVFPRYRRILMNFHTPIVEAGDGTATARTYVVEKSMMADGRPYGPIGTYFDRCVEQDGRWRYAWRLFQTQYSGPPDMTGEFFDNPDFGPPPAMPPLDTMAIDHTGALKRMAAEKQTQ